MLTGTDRDEVVQVIVFPVVISVMDMPSFWDRPMCSFPFVTMEELSAA